MTVSQITAKQAQCYSTYIFTLSCWQMAYVYSYLSSHEAIRVGDGHTDVASMLMPVAHTEID